MERRFKENDHVQGKTTGHKGRVVNPCRTDRTFKGLVEVAWDYGGRAVLPPDSLELVPYKPSWFEVTVGCTVDFTYEGAKYTVEVKSCDDYDSALILGRDASEWEYDPSARLVTITKPKPPKALSWNDVKAGDKVTFEFRGEAFTATAYRKASEVLVLGSEVQSQWLTSRFTLISIERPTPPLPTKPGTALEVHGIPGLVHRRRVRLDDLDLTWISDSSGKYTDDQIAARSWKVAS